MWILKKKEYNYWWQKYGLEKTDRATKTSLFDRNWETSLKPRQRSRPLRLVWRVLLRKWCYTRLQRDFPLHPLISPFHFHFRTYKRDLVILTEWWQHRIAWWELLNAPRQIICICKQHTNHMEDNIRRILQDKQFHLQLKSEQKEIIQNVLERKDSMAVLPMGFGKSMCYVLLPHFGQGKIIYANHLPWYIAVIVVFSKSRDKCLKVKVKWRNERV